MSRPFGALQVAHQFIESHVRPGAFCIDATAGRGNDTVFLASLVGETGKVLAFDIQPEAVESTRAPVSYTHLYIRKADDALRVLGYTEHSFAHVTKVARKAREILLTLGYPERTAELAQIAGYLHDIGNVINRADHAQSGAVMAFRILDKLGADAEDTATIISAIGTVSYTHLMQRR